MLLSTKGDANKIPYLLHARKIGKATASKGQCRRRRRSPDSSACEGLLGRLKVELLYDRNRSGRSVDDFIDAVDRHIL